MNITKRAAVLLLTLALVLTSAVSFAAESPKLIPIKGATVTTADRKTTWDGTVKSATITVTLDGKTLKEGTDYTVSGNKTPSSFADTYRLTAKIRGIGKYTGKISKSYNLYIKKATQKLKGTFKYTVKSGKTARIQLKINAAGKLVFKEAVNGLRVNSKGTVIVSKYLAPGTYTIEVHAKKTDNYKRSGIKTVTVVVD